MNSAPFSETTTPQQDPPPPGRLAVLEGLPGAGKTTIARSLEGAFPLIAEYTTPAGAPLAQHAHPPVHDDGAHQDNWLTKTGAACRLLACSSLVVCDRDWLTPLGYAYSTGDAELLEYRCIWALHHLRQGTLRSADLCILLDIDPPTSLARRAARLRPGHPWSTPAPLRRLADFYREPARVLPDELAEHLPAFARIPAHRPSEYVLEDVTALLEGLR